MEGFNADEFWLTAYGESKLNLKAKGDFDKKLGINKSRGMWQINLVAHPDVTIKCAEDPVCSTAKAVALWKETPLHWSCYRELVGIFLSNACGYKKIAIPPVVWAKDDQ